MSAARSSPRQAAERAWRALRPGLAADAGAALGPAEADAFLTRVEVALPDIHGPLAELYGAHREDVDALFERALRLVLAAAIARPAGAAGDLQRGDVRGEVRGDGGDDAGVRVERLDVRVRSDAHRPRLSTITGLHLQ